MPDFFETVKRGIEKGVATVGAKSKEMIEVSQLRSQIRGLEEEKGAKVEELGNVAHVMLVRGKLDEVRLREKSEAIAALETKIKANEEQIRAIQLSTEEVMRGAGPRLSGQCSCGANLLEGAKFCGGCGKSVTAGLSEGIAPGETGQPSCPSCRGLLLPAAKFCGKCGAPAGE